MFSFSLPLSVIPRRSSLTRIVEQSTTLLMVTIGALILILALLILFHQNANATKGYDLRSLEQQRTQLHLEEEIVKMQIAEEQGLDHLQNDPRVLHMKPVTDPQYVIGTHPMALRGTSGN